MNTAGWVDALLSAPYTAGMPRYVEHCVVGRLCAWELSATEGTRAALVLRWWREAAAREGDGDSLSMTGAWWRPWPDDATLELAWNRAREGMRWVAEASRWSDASESPLSERLLRAAHDALDDPERFPHPEALEAEVEQLLRAAERALPEGAPARVSSRLRAARRASRGLLVPPTLHVPLSDVRSVRALALARGAASPSALREAYQRVVIHGAALRDRCAAAFGASL